MFQSGFLIFIIRKANLTQYSLLQSKTIQQQYKQLIINNKISLVSNQFNLNSLKYIMIKLGILYKEFDLLNRGFDDIQFFDLKTANLLMEYILKSSSLSYIVTNLNDNFFIYTIKKTILFIISQFKKRIENLKNILKGILVKSTGFLDLYIEHNEFKELIILSKYLDILRQLDNDIHFNRKICSKSLSNQIETLSATVHTINFEGENINYLTNQLNTGKIANVENYIIHKITFPSLTNIQLLKKMIVELYCYKILQEDEQMYYYVCINILRNVCYNPNIFFRNIAMKTHIKSLRNFLIKHLQHSHFISIKEERYLSFMKYIEQNYSNPSFEVEYRVKATDTLLFKEYKSTINDNGNDGKTMITLITNSNDRYYSFTSSITPKSRYKKLEYTKFNSTCQTRKGNLIKEGPLLTEANVLILNSMINESLFYSWIDFSEIYELMFFNNDINDFGLNKYSIQKSLMFIQNNSFYILQELLNNYFYDQEEKFYLLTNKIHKVECVYCKKSSINQGNSAQGLIRNTKHFGYSNISIEDIKSFTDENINRIEIDDYLKKHNSFKDINALMLLYCNDDNKIRSMFNYIKGHYMHDLLFLFIENLCNANHFKDYFIDKEKEITSSYFNSNNGSFNYIKVKYLKLISLNNNIETDSSIDNSEFNKALFSLLLYQGILINNNTDDINTNLIQELIRNRLFKVNESSMHDYELIKSNDINVEDFIMKHNISSRYNTNQSQIDDCMDQYILFHDSNYYLLQAFFDINLFNPKIILSELYHSLNTWQRAIILSKFPNDDDDLIFNIALENLNIVTFPNNSQNIILYGCLIYLKRTNIEWETTLLNLTKGAFNLKNLIEEFTQMTLSILPKSSVEQITEPIDLINTIKTHNEDISIRAMVNQFYPYLKTDNYIKWRQRGLNINMYIDDFEILIENGRIIDAYYYYKENLKQNTSKKELANWLYKICFNNLLNYNVFATSVTLLQLLNENQTENKDDDDDDDTKEIIVQVEAANRILTYELNLLSKNNEQLRNDLFSFIKQKNYNKDKETIESNTDIYFYNLNTPFKEAIGKYNVLVKQFQELKSSLKANNQKHATLIFDVLKRLEDSTWADKQNAFDQAKVDTSWHLVSLFCKINNYEMSLTNLHDFGRHNNWISFLHKAQEQDCSPMTIYTILNSYVTDERLKNHLIIAIEPLINQSEHVIQNVNEDLLINLEKEKEVINKKQLIIDSISRIKALDEYVLFTIKTDITKSQSNQHCDPLYYLTNIELDSNNNNKAIKISNILNEALQLNWKEMLLVALTQTQTSNSNQSPDLVQDVDTLFILFGLYLYMSLKEIFVANFPFENHINNNTSLLEKLIDVFDSKRKLYCIKELKVIMQFLILNNYQQVITEAYQLFALPYAFDEFILFTHCINNNDYETAFVHLYVFKEMTIESFQSFNIDTNKIQYTIDQIDYAVKPIEFIILVFFYSLSDSIISSLLVSVENEEYKLFKLLEVLYLANWSDTISNYFKNLNVINSLKHKSHLTYHASYDVIVNYLINQHEYDLLTEYMKSYSVDDTENVLLHKVFHSIEVFDKYYVLFTIVERIQFWDFIDELLLSSSSSFSVFKAAYVFLMLINDKERRMYLKEQLYLIHKIYCYFNKSSDISESIIISELKELSVFIKSKGFETELFTSCQEVLLNLQHNVYVIIFSSFNYEQLNTIFNTSSSFDRDNILSNCFLFMNSLKEGDKRISFNHSDDLKEKLYNACINFINLNQLSLSIDLCDYYNCQFDEIKQFQSLIMFFKDNYEALMQLNSAVIYQLYLKAIDERLVVQEQIIKNDSFDIEEQLIMNVAWCIGLSSLKNQVLFELIKLTIANILLLSCDMYMNFNDNIEIILNQIIQNDNIDKEKISHLNTYMNNGDRLAKIIIQLFSKNKSKITLSLFHYIDFFDSPMILGKEVMRMINRQKDLKEKEIFTLFQWELIMLAYYCFLSDTRHDDLNALNNTIAEFANDNNNIFYQYLFEVLSLCNDETKAKELFFCLNKHLFKDKENNSKGYTCLNDIDWFKRLKLQIEFYNHVKLYNKLGEIYIDLAEEYKAISKEKKELYLNNRSQQEMNVIEQQDNLNILNYYIRAAEQFSKENWIINYNKAIENIKALIKDKFKDFIVTNE